MSNQAQLKRYGKIGNYRSVVELSDGEYVKFSDIEPLIEALRFYADRKNYSLDDYRGLSGEMSYRNILHGDMEEINDVSSVAGRKAREALRKVGINGN